VAGTAASCLKVDSHGDRLVLFIDCLPLKSEDEGGEVRVVWVLSTQVIGDDHTNSPIQCLLATAGP
jgi:hypothetical protein